MAEESNQRAGSLSGGGISVTIMFPNGDYAITNTLIKECYFIEDIFSPFIYGKLTFVDNFGIVELGPLTGNETVVIKYTGTGEETGYVTRYFYVYKIDEISQINTSNAGGHAISLHLIDPFYSAMGIKQYSRSWPKDTDGHEIVKHIITKMCQIDEKFIDSDIWEDTREKMDYFYMPYWTPIDSIKWLMKRFSGKRSELGGYLFYASSKDLWDKKDREGGSTLNFVTMDALLGSKELMKISKGDTALYKNTGEMITEEDEYNHIMSYIVDGIDKNAIKGIAGGHYFGFNNKDKSPIDKTYTYADMIEKHTILGNMALFEDLSEVDAGRTFTGEQNETFIDNIMYGDWVRRYVMQNYIVITVSGHERRYCGGLINIHLPSSMPESAQVDSNKNEMISGTCLVKSITHWFSPQDTVNYRQKMVLIKNGYQNDKIEILLPAKKKNDLT